MAKKNNTVSTLKETQWNVLNITLVKMLEALTDMTGIKETLTDIKETLTDIKDMLAEQAAGKDAPASEPVQLTIGSARHKGAGSGQVRHIRRRRYSS